MKEVPTLLKGLDQVAVQQLHNILQTATPQPGENQHPLITANLATLKETVMDKVWDYGRASGYTLTCTFTGH